ncbi:hypothetical protein D8911_11650 [Levilactobacillus brevis]|nr:hypothetical protein D8911_11650 [Levilactobacillus brevis]
MNPKYFAQEVAARAIQAKYKRDYDQLEFTVAAAAGAGKTIVEVTSKYAYPQTVIQALEDNDIVYVKEESVEDSIVTTFDISKLGVIK